MQYADLQNNETALFTLVSENQLKHEALPVVDKAINQGNFNLKLYLSVAKKGGAYSLLPAKVIDELIFQSLTRFFANYLQPRRNFMLRENEDATKYFQKRLLKVILARSQSQEIH